MKYGWYATFMPKPLQGENGSGMHVHQSLSKDGKNAFFNPDDQYFLSDVAKAFIAGQLKHAREISPLFAQWVNSYKRLVPGYEAPVYLSWSRRNRSALIRVPLYHPGKEQATRRNCAARTPPATRISVSRECCMPGSRESSTATGCPSRWSEPLPPHPGGAPSPRRRGAARDAGQGDRGRRGVGAGPPDPWRARVQPLRRDQAGRVGGLRVQVTPFEIEQFLPIL